MTCIYVMMYDAAGSLPTGQLAVYQPQPLMQSMVCAGVYRIYSRISRPLKMESVCGPKSLTRV